MAQRKKKAKAKRSPAPQPAPTRPDSEATKGGDPVPGATEKAEAPSATRPGGTPSPSDEHPYAGLVFVGVIMGLILLAIATQLVMD